MKIKKGHKYQVYAGSKSFLTGKITYDFYNITVLDIKGLFFKKYFCLYDDGEAYWINKHRFIAEILEILA